MCYLLTEDVKDTYDAQVDTGTTHSLLQESWSYVVRALLERFLTDDVLHAAHV